MIILYNYQGEGWELINGLTRPHICAWPSPGPGFPTSYVMVFFVFNDLRWEEVVRFVDIGKIVGHYFLNFLS